jgi:hypothetical protein
MNTLKEEVREYLKEIDNIDCSWTESDEDIVNKFYDFALNSKWVKVEKIKAKIEEINSIITCYVLNKEMENDLRLKVSLLESQIKEIEDGLD